MYIVTVSPIAILVQEIYVLPLPCRSKRWASCLILFVPSILQGPSFAELREAHVGLLQEYYRQYCSGMMLRMGQLFLRTLVNKRQRRASMLASLQRVKTSYSKLRPYRHLGSSFQVGLNNRPPIAFHRGVYGLHAGDGGDS